MNYLFQFDGLIIDDVQANFDYSRFRVDLDEAHLDRSAGMTADQSLVRYGSQMYCKCDAGTTQIDSVAGPVDWDCSGRGTNQEPHVVHQDVNRTCTEESLAGAEDWSHIQLTSPSPLTGAPARTVTVQEADVGMARQVQVVRVSGVTGTAMGKAARIQWKPIPLDRVLAYRVFRREAGSAQAIKVASTDKASALDSGVEPGKRYAYTVSALLADRGGSEQVFLDPKQIASFRAFVSPTLSRQWASMGRTASEGLEAWKIPKVLLQTKPSAPVIIEIGR